MRCKRVKPQYIALLKHETMWTFEVKYKHFYVKIDDVKIQALARSENVYKQDFVFKRALKC